MEEMELNLQCNNPNLVWSGCVTYARIVNICSKIVFIVKKSWDVELLK